MLKKSHQLPASPACVESEQPEVKAALRCCWRIRQQERGAQDAASSGESRYGGGRGRQGAEVGRGPGARRGRTADGGLALVDGPRGRGRGEGLAAGAGVAAVPEARHRRVVAVGLVADVGAAGRRRGRLVDAPVVAVRPVARGVAARAARRVAGRRRRARRGVQRLLGVAAGRAAVGRARRTCEPGTMLASPLHHLFYYFYILNYLLLVLLAPVSRR